MPQCFGSSAEDSFQNWNNFFLTLFVKWFYTYMLKPQSNRSWKIEDSFSCDSWFAKYGPTNIRANFGKSYFSSIFELEMYIFMIFSIYYNRFKAYWSIVRWQNVNFCPKFYGSLRLIAGRLQLNLYPRICMTYILIWYGCLRYLPAISKMSL